MKNVGIHANTGMVVPGTPRRARDRRSLDGRPGMSWTSLTSRRRTPEQMAELLDGMLAIVMEEESQITIRHLFYRLVGLRIIEKTEQAYKSLCGHLSRWRKSGDVPW